MHIWMRDDALTLRIQQKNNYPPGSKCEALRLGVHLLLLYFIRISLLNAETFFYFDGGWLVGPTFWFFKSLYINMVYTFGIYLDF